MYERQGLRFKPLPYGIHEPLAKKGMRKGYADQIIFLVHANIKRSKPARKFLVWINLFEVFAQRIFQHGEEVFLVRYSCKKEERFFTLNKEEK